MPPNVEEAVSSPDSSIVITPAPNSPTPSDTNSFSSLSSDSDSGVQLDPTSIVVYEHIRIPLEQNLKQLLQKVTGTNDLQTVTQVKLRVIAREVSLQHLSIHIPFLKELILDGSVVSSLRDLGSGLKNLKILHVNRCGLTSLDGIFGLEGLEEFYVANNSIIDASQCAFLPDIRIIDLRQNCITDMKSLSFLSMCTSLEHLLLENNNEIVKLSDYRQRIHSLIPGLKTLDNIDFTAEDIGNIDGEGFEKTLTGKADNAESHTFASAAKTSFLPPINVTPNSSGFPSQAHRPYSSRSDRKCVKSNSSRPHTAKNVISINDKFEKTELPEIFKSNESEKSVPSLLTSGLPICGNVAAAFRNRKKTQEAWAEKKDKNEK